MGTGTSVMNNDGPLDADEARRRREEKIAQIDGVGGTLEWWRVYARAAVFTLAAQRPEGSRLTTDDVWHHLWLRGIPEPREFCRDNRAMGGVMRYAESQGWIVPIDHAVDKSQKKLGNVRNVQVYLTTRRPVPKNGKGQKQGR